MKPHLISMLALVGAVACGGGTKDAARADSLSRDLAMAPADSHATGNDRPAANPRPATPRPVASAPRMLAAGTEFAAGAMDSINSRTNKAGETMHVRVSSDVKDPQGRTIIPAGSIVALHIDVLGPAENDNDHTGKLTLTPTSVEINGVSHGLSARVDSVKYVLHGRGVTAGDAAKVGAGAVAGGVAGRVLGGNRRGTIIGAVVGAAAGAAVASKTNDRDVVIRPGDYVRIVLTGAFGV
jgi:outer membrane lipoprotein SlyB